jgi:hypothetical protein
MNWLVFLGLVGLATLGHAAPAGGPRAPTVSVDLEEDVYTYTPADNGAGPMWCSGSTCIVRVGHDLFVSGLETLAEAKPLNNCRWFLLRRTASGWQRQQTDPRGRTREPSPLVAFPNGELFLSANPTLVADPNAYGGPAQPEVWRFLADRPPAAPDRLLPVWAGEPTFTEHSYRSFAADGESRELLLFQNIDYTHAEWTFRDQKGRWSAHGQLTWPWGADYAKPQPIRVCYPNVALRRRTVHFCGVSDVVEPNPAWREYKRQLTGREWDYDFRRLFYTSNPDITQGAFTGWLEISSREATCGWIMPADLWAAPDGSAHLLWTERALDERLRERFFPGARQSHQLNYARVERGAVTLRRALIEASEGGAREIPAAARFHVTPARKLFVICYVSGTDPEGKPVSENRLFELDADGRPGESHRLPFARPFTSFFTATPRAGCAPSETIDLLGTRAGLASTLSYGRVRLH